MTHNKVAIMTAFSLSDAPYTPEDSVGVAQRTLVTLGMANPTARAMVMTLEQAQDFSNAVSQAIRNGHEVEMQTNPLIVVCIEFNAYPWTAGELFGVN